MHNVEDIKSDILNITGFQKDEELNLLQKLASRAASIFLIYIALLVVAACAFALIEHKSFGDAIWWASVTATSVGYGDVTPTGMTGRIIGMILMNMAVLLITPIITAKLSAIMIVDSNAWTDQEQEEVKAHERLQTQLLQEIVERLDAIEAKI